MFSYDWSYSIAKLILIFVDGYRIRLTYGVLSSDPGDPYDDGVKLPIIFCYFILFNKSRYIFYFFFNLSALFNIYSDYFLCYSVLACNAVKSNVATGIELFLFEFIILTRYLSLSYFYCFIFYTSSFRSSILCS